jgi:hypothetical protein
MGLYTGRNKNHWTPKVTLEGYYGRTERNGSKGPNLDVDVDHDN